MKFNNKENERIILQNGREIWLSRAVAVVGTVCVIKEDVPYFLISKRGKGSADHQGLYNITCGYLDWNETTGDAFAREVWEECGINIHELMKNLLYKDYSKTPWDVNSFPDENRQNVSIHHAIVCHVDELPTPVIRNEVESEEVEEVRWIKIDEIDNFDFAFNHNERLKKFINEILK